MTVSFLAVSKDPSEKQRRPLETEELPLEVNLSNANAAAMLRLMGMPAEMFGECTDEQMDQAIGRLLRVANSQDARRSEVRGSLVIERGGALREVANGQPICDGGSIPRFVSFGMTDEGIADRALRLLELFRKAKSCGKTVVWG